MPSPGRKSIPVLRYKDHQLKWKDCTRCELHQRRTKVVLARGSLPCQILFVGEAPGASEDVLGRPFAGPAGKLLDQIIARSLPGNFCPVCEVNPCFSTRSGITCKMGHGGAVEREDFVAPPAFALTNVVSCIPLDPDGEGKTAEPPYEALVECRPRLEEFLTLARPKAIVCVGKTAENWMRQGYKDSPKIPKRKDGGPVVIASMPHPAFVLRANFAQKSLLLTQCEVAIQDALEEAGIGS